MRLNSTNGTGLQAGLQFSHLFGKHDGNDDRQPFPLIWLDALGTVSQ